MAAPANRPAQSVAATTAPITTYSWRPLETLVRSLSARGHRDLPLVDDHPVDTEPVPQLSKSRDEECFLHCRACDHRLINKMNVVPGKRDEVIAMLRRSVRTAGAMNDPVDRHITC